MTRLFPLVLALFVIAGSARAQAPPTGDCYYLADSSLEAAAAAAEFAFPFRIGQQPTAESRAVHEVFQRTLEEDLRSIGHSWLQERTPQGRRYVSPNGISVQLRTGSCAEGMDRVRTYLMELESIAATPEIATALASFRENAREIGRHEFDWASPPIPVAVEPSQARKFD